MTDDFEDQAAATPTGDPWLLTPGPLTTAPEVKQAMLHDLGSRDTGFIALNRRLRERLLRIVGDREAFTCVPLQGSGTFAVEAMLGTLLPPDGKLLILVNGAYGQRMAKICRAMGAAHSVIEQPEDQPTDLEALSAALADDPAVTHVAAVHCETTTGMLNPIREIGRCVARHERRLLIDAMSAFGALPLEAAEVAFDAVAASSNKCLEGVPGMGFCILRKAALEDAAGNCHSLSLDLYEQWRAMEGNGQWRFTPPVQVIAAFDRALDDFEAEGGVAGRHARYAENCRLLVEGMRALGFETLLPDALQAPIIVTFHQPADPRFAFEDFYERLRRRGYVIYPGKLTVAESFRIGCIGRIGAEEMRGALAAVEAALGEMGVTDRSAAVAA